MSVYETSFMVIDFWLPKIIYDSNRITARTCILLQLFTLFSMKRTVLVDSKCRRVTISTRSWWILNSSERIPFEAIRHIGISEMTVGKEPGYTPEGMGWRDQQENYLPYIMTNDGRIIELLSFYGEGSVHTGWLGVVLGDQIIDFRGRQEKRAREFAERVSKLVGVPCGIKSKPVSNASTREGKAQCPSCGHYNSVSCTKCLYCGAHMQVS
jgi:hypothetical protein